MIRFSLLCLFFLMFTAWSSAQTILPKGFAPGEEAMMSSYLLEQSQQRGQNCETLPPDISARSIGEWEELDAIAIAWTSFPEILTEIVRHAREEVEVLILTTNPNSVQAYLQNAGVDTDSNVTLLPQNFNSIWIRDYGPNTVYLDEVGQLALVDWIYNRPRPLDDNSPQAIADYLDIPMYCTTVAPTDLVHTGGNYMSDGMGTSFSSELVLHENDITNEWGISNHSEEEIDQIMLDFMGVERYPKMTNLPFDGIHHIDMHMKLLDEETLLVGEYPEGVADGPQIEANMQYILSNYLTPYGNPYRLIRIPMPPDENGQYPDAGWWADYRTYTNAVFVNKTILVPTYDEQYDTTALRIWSEAMPGFQIEGIDCNEIIPLSGAIHCITKEIGTKDPLLITHQQVRESCVEDEMALAVTAKHLTNIQGVRCYYKTELDADFSFVNMSALSGELFEATLPAPDPAATQMEYYFEGTAYSGKQIRRPLVAPEGTFTTDLILCNPTSVEEVDPGLRLEAVFPNPASAITAIPVQNDHREVEGSIVLYNLLGQGIQTIHQGKIPVGKTHYFFDASRLASGMYQLEMRVGHRQWVQRVVVK